MFPAIPPALALETTVFMLAAICTYYALMPTPVNSYWESVMERHFLRIPPFSYMIHIRETNLSRNLTFRDIP